MNLRDRNEGVEFAGQRPGEATMGVFDFIMALYSIIAGLGVSVLVKDVALMIEARGSVRLYWVHTCWVIFLFGVQIISWFALWRLRELTAWTALEALLLLLVPILLNAVSYLAVPDLDS